MRGLLCGSAVLALAALHASRAQTLHAPAAATPATHSAAAHAATPHTAALHAGKKHKVAAHVPVVAPHHGVAPRHPVAHKPVPKKAVIVEKPPEPAKQTAPRKPAPPPVPPDVGTVTGMHLPRYASLKSDDVNMRVGPAERYPVIWNYKRRELPVKIEREFDIWRLVEDMDGTKGWVQQGTITGRRTFVITGTEDRTMRGDANETAEAVAILKPGVVGRIKSCEAGRDWCQVQVQDYRGWLKRTDFWGVDPGEVVTP